MTGAESDGTLESHQTPHISPSLASYGASCVTILEKTNRVVTTPHSILLHYIVTACTLLELTVKESNRLAILQSQQKAYRWSLTAASLSQYIFLYIYTHHQHIFIYIYIHSPSIQPSNIRRTKSPKIHCFSSRLEVVSVQSIEARLRLKI